MCLDRDEPVGFSKFKLSIVGGFHSFVVARVPEKFPRLKMAFLEVSAQWVPYAFRDLVKRFRRQGRELEKDFIRELVHLRRHRDQRRPSLHFSNSR